MIKRIVALVEVVYWFLSGASIIYPGMTRWEIAKKIWKDAIKKVQ